MRYLWRSATRRATAAATGSAPRPTGLLAGLVAGPGLDRLLLLLAGPDLDLPRRRDRLGHRLHPDPQQAPVGLGLHLVRAHPLGQLERAPERAVAQLAYQHLAAGVLPVVLALAADGQPAVDYLDVDVGHVHAG